MGFFDQPCSHPLWPLISGYLGETLHLPWPLTVDSRPRHRTGSRDGKGGFLLSGSLHLYFYQTCDCSHYCRSPGAISTDISPQSFQPQVGSAGTKGDKAEAMPAKPRCGVLVGQGPRGTPSWLQLSPRGVV